MTGRPRLRLGVFPRWGRAATLGLVLLLTGTRSVRAQEEGSKAPLPDRWVFVFVMSYDNDLAEFGAPILGAIESGLRDSTAVAVVLHDDPAPDGLRRHVVTAAGRTTERLATDDSASEAVLGEQLDWVARTHLAAHHALVFLDHGGGLDQMCRDDDGGARRPGRWLSARRVAPLLESWRRSLRGRLDLLFLQQCGRGSIETAYVFRRTAEHLLLSQADVGTPNTWYEATLRWLGGAEGPTGRALARRILDEDQDYLDYACVDARALEDLPGRLDAVCAPLAASGKDLRRPAGIAPCFVRAGDVFFDLRHWLRGAYRDAAADPAPLRPFEEWFTTALVVEHASRGASARSWCGLSLLVPEDETRPSHRDHPLYDASTLDDLWHVANATPR